MEDYKEKHEQALERCRKLYNEAKNLEYNQDMEDLEQIFPELAESEDERIRKAIKYCIKQGFIGYGKIENVTPDECLAWLEKQSNTIPDECVFRPVAGCNIESAAKQAIKQQGVLAKKIVLAFNGAYIPVGGKAADIVVNEYNFWLEKQGETYTKKDVDDAYLKGVCDAKQELEKQGEKKLANSAKTCKKSQRMVSAEVKEALYDKPAWSEEDELVVEDIEEAVINYWHGQLQEDLLDWLKSLKERIGG